MIQYSQIEHKKQSFVVTAILFLLLFLLFFFLKYNSQAKIEALEGGGGGGEIEVNFGNSDLGSGENFESMEVAQPAPKAVEKEQIAKEDLVTNASDEEAPMVAAVKKPKDEPKKAIEKPVEIQKPKPSKSTTDALSNLLNNSNTKGGDGDDDEAGNKGKANGNTKATGYDGGGGSGTGSGGGSGSGQGLGSGSGYGTGVGSGSGAGNGNWKLAGRKLSNRSKQIQKCNEYGTVVVQVTVNRNGNVIAAKYAKGTTNTNQCLLEPAYATAKSYKWQPDENAPETQIGFITINFKLSE
jgi:outer membrane biosynthesis protein TonB